MQEQCMEREAVPVQEEGAAIWVQEPARGDSTWCLTLVAQLSWERARLGAGFGVGVSECPQWVCSQEEMSY